jgi:hypothetical protein
MLAFRPKGKAFRPIIRDRGEWLPCGKNGRPPPRWTGRAFRAKLFCSILVEAAFTINRFLNRARQSTVNSKDWPLCQ